MRTKLGEIIELPKIFDPRGSLTVVEQTIHIPFVIKKTEWIYNIVLRVPIHGETVVGKHKVMVALSGSFDVIIRQGGVKQEFGMNHPYQGLLIYSGASFSIENASNGAVCLVFSD